MMRQTTLGKHGGNSGKDHAPDPQEVGARRPELHSQKPKTEPMQYDIQAMLQASPKPDFLSPGGARPCVALTTGRTLDLPTAQRAMNPRVGTIARPSHLCQLASYRLSLPVPSLKQKGQQGKNGGKAAMPPLEKDKGKVPLPYKGPQPAGAPAQPTEKASTPTPYHMTTFTVTLIMSLPLLTDPPIQGPKAHRERASSQAPPLARMMCLASPTCQVSKKYKEKKEEKKGTTWEGPKEALRPPTGADRAEDLARKVALAETRELLAGTNVQGHNNPPLQGGGVLTSNPSPPRTPHKGREDKVGQAS